MKPVAAGFARRFRFLRLLRAVLVTAGALDLAAAGALVAAPVAAGRWLGLSPPLPPFNWLLAVLFTVAGLSVLLAAREVRRYSAVIALTLAGRLVAAALLAAFCYTGAGPYPGLLLVAAVELALGVLLALLWHPVYG